MQASRIEPRRLTSKRFAVNTPSLHQSAGSLDDRAAIRDNLNNGARDAGPQFYFCFADFHQHLAPANDNDPAFTQRADAARKHSLPDRDFSVGCEAVIDLAFDQAVGSVWGYMQCAGDIQNHVLTGPICFGDNIVRVDFLSEAYQHRAGDRQQPFTHDGS